MATLPKSDPTHHPLTATELLAIRGTPEFEAEYMRQLCAISERDRSTNNADRMPIDWEWLDRVWK